MLTLWGQDLKLDELKAKLSPKRMDRMLAGMAENMGEKVMELVHAEFKAELDPRGTNWKARKREPKPWHPIHHDSGDLEDSLRMIGFHRAGFAIASDLEYAAIRNYGLPLQDWPKARAMLPAKGTIPDPWNVQLAQVSLKTVDDYFGGT